jgi:uncharacterized protein (TIGR02271 family)
MSKLFGFMGDDEKDIEQVEQVDDVQNVADGTLRLREEELDVSKYSVHTGEVTLHKDIIEEQQTVHIPVTHEQVVIERRAVNEPSDIPVGEEEVIHIPVSEERVSVDKHTIVTGEVALHKRSIEEDREVTETIRKEKARLDVDGHPDLVNESGVDLR